MNAWVFPKKSLNPAYSWPFRYPERVNLTEDCAIPRTKNISEKIADGIFKSPIEGTPKHDAVNHPKHYTSHPSGVECIQITEHYNFCVGNAIKYLWRAGLKDAEVSSKEVEDCKKAIWYIQRQIENLEKKNASS